MALVDALVASIRAELHTALSRSQGDSLLRGRDRVDHVINTHFTEGNSTTANQAMGVFTAEFSVTVATNTISLAAFDLSTPGNNPLGALGDDVPSMDPEGGVIRAILLENLDSVNGGNVITLATPASNNLAGVLGGASQSIICDPNGIFLWVGQSSAIADGSSDEITLAAAVAPITVRFSYLFSGA